MYIRFFISYFLIVYVGKYIEGVIECGNKIFLFLYLFSLKFIIWKILLFFSVGFGRI